MFYHAVDVIECDFWGDVVAPVIQRSDFVMFNNIQPLSVHVSD